MLPGGSETILYVEDEITVRSLTAHVLRRLGYTVLEAGDGEQARDHRAGAKRAAHRPPLLRCRPAGSQRQGARRLGLRARDAETKLLFTSGYVDESVLRHHGVSPEMAFLRKPFSPGDLARKLREVMDDTSCLPAG